MAWLNASLPSLDTPSVHVNCDLINPEKLELNPETALMICHDSNLAHPYRTGSIKLAASKEN
jgi:hypothetical protein